MDIRHGNMKVLRSKWFKDVYQATEIVDDNAGVGQMTSPNGLGWRSVKRQQQRKIVTVGERYYAPPTLLMEEDTERRRYQLLPSLNSHCRPAEWMFGAECISVNIWNLPKVSPGNPGNVLEICWAGFLETPEKVLADAVRAESKTKLSIMYYALLNVLGGWLCRQWICVLIHPSLTTDAAFDFFVWSPSFSGYRYISG